MVKKYIRNLLIGLSLSATLVGSAQNLSIHTVKYKLTYDSASQFYTAWVVPDYSVPNTHNPQTTERGSTAQFSLVVPKDFVLTELVDIKGHWTKPSDANFMKFGKGQPQQNWEGLAADMAYYVIGKSSEETDYGNFTEGVPVALFRFRGNAYSDKVQPLATNDAFVQKADKTYSLNVGSSFYSVSGQATGTNTRPQEQFKAVLATTSNGSNNRLQNDWASTRRNKALFYTVKSKILRGGVLTQKPLHGEAYFVDNQQIVYVPAANYCGEDSLKYAFCTNGICDTAALYIQVVCHKLQVYSGFSPNEDGVNDYLTIEGIELFPKNALSIYNRYGSRVYEKKGYKNDWNGSFEGKPLPDGTYFYTLDDGNGNNYSGYVQLSR